MAHYKVNVKFYKWTGSKEPADSYFSSKEEEFEADDNAQANRKLDDIVRPVRSLLEDKGFRVRVQAEMEEID